MKRLGRSTYRFQGRVVMKRSFFLPIFIVLAASAFTPECSSNKKCASDVNKTFLMPRSHGVNSALEYTNGWRDIIYRHENGACASNLQGSFFYERTNDDCGIGRYFSPKKAGNSKDCSDTCDFSFGSRVGTDQTISEDLNLRNFIQLLNRGETTTDEHAATMDLRMNRKSFGFVFNWHQYLDFIVKGLFFKVNMPFAHVQNTIKCCITTNHIKLGDDTIQIHAEDLKDALASYFAGETVQVTRADGSQQNILQDKLAYEIIPSKKTTTACNQDCPTSNRRPTTSTSGLADLDLQLGYHFLYTSSYNAYIALGATIPTGNEAQDRRTWEPMVGNGGHYGLGFNLYADWRAWSNKDHNLVLQTALNYRWLFENCEKRKLGLCNQQWGHYRLLGKFGQKTLVPAANILLKKIEVEPGNQVDWMVQAHYTWRQFGIDLGYNLYFRDEEKIKNVCGSCSTIIPKNTYAFPNKEFNGNIAFGSNNSTFEDPNNPTFLSDKDINKQAAATPSQLSHKIYAGLSWNQSRWMLPVIVGIGGHYEFGDGNQTPNSWGISLKTAVEF